MPHLHYRMGVLGDVLLDRTARAGHSIIRIAVRVPAASSSRYQLPVYEDDLFVHAYPVEAFSITVLQPQPCYSIDEEQQSTRRGEEVKCPSLLVFVAMMVVNPVKCFFDRIDE